MDNKKKQLHKKAINEKNQNKTNVNLYNNMNVFIINNYMFDIEMG